MNIGIAAFSFPPERNGVSSVAFAHARGFVSRGHKVIVLTGFIPDRDVQYFMSEGIEVKQFRVQGRRTYTGEIAEYISALQALDVDVLFLHCWQAWTTDLALGCLDTNRVRKNAIISHGVSVNEITSFKSIIGWLRWRPYVWGMVDRMKSVDRVIFLTGLTDRNRLFDSYLAKKAGLQNIAVVPNGGQPPPTHLIRGLFRKEYGIQTELMALCASNFDRAKGQEMVLDAFEKSKFSQATLVFIGGERNSYCRRLEYLISKSLCSSRVRVLTNVSRSVLQSAYVDSDIFLLGSRSEVQPLVLLDGMAAGLPFVSTSVGSVREMKGGITCASATTMAQMICLLLESQELRAELSSRGQKQVASHYNWERIIDSYEQLLGDLTRQRDGESKPRD